MESNKDILRIFSAREFSLLAGKSSGSLILLTITLAVSLFGIALAHGSYLSIRERLNNPFASVIPVEVPMTEEARYYEMGNELREVYQDTFGITSIERYMVGSQMGFISLNERKTFRLPRRTIEPGSRIASLILDPGNIISMRDSSWFDPEEERLCSVILTHEAMEFLGYPIEAQCVLLMPNAYVIDLPIGAVVSQLPDNAEVALTTSFAVALENPGYYSGFLMADDAQSTAFSVLFMRKDSLQAQIGGMERDIPSLAGVFRHEREIHVSDTDTLSLVKWTSSDPLSAEKPEEYWDSLQSTASIIRYPPYDWSCRYNEHSPDRMDYMGIHLSNLASTPALREFLLARGIALDMSLVQSKMALSDISRLAFILGLVLAVSCGALLIFFLLSRVQMHFSKRMKAIGTLLASGADPQQIVHIYLKILGRFLLTASVSAFAFTIVLSLVLNLIFPSISARFLGGYVLSFLMIINLITLVFIYGYIRKFLKHTPGYLVKAGS